MLKARCGTPEPLPDTVVVMSAELAEQATPGSASRRRGRRPVSVTGDETRERIVQAAIDTLDAEGIVGTSARAIARRGAFNQALIFYHFGSVDDALVAAFELLLDQQRVRYAASLAETGSLDDICGRLTQMFQEDRASGTTTTIAQGFAGAAHRPHMGPRLRAATRAWLDAIESHGVRIGMAPRLARQGADRFLALYLGFDLLQGLDAAHPGAEHGLVDLTQLQFVPDARDGITVRA